MNIDEVLDIVTDHVLSTAVVKGLPLPPWAAHFGGVVIPPNFLRDQDEPREFTLAAYLWGRGTA